MHTHTYMIITMYTDTNVRTMDFLQMTFNIECLLWHQITPYFSVVLRRLYTPDIDPVCLVGPIAPAHMTPGIPVTIVVAMDMLTDSPPINLQR